MGRKKQWKRGVRIALLVATIIGAILFLVQLVFFVMLRSANSEPEQGDIFIKMDEVAIYHIEQAGGIDRQQFNYNGEVYTELDLNFFQYDSLECVVPDKQLTEENAVLNIRSKRSLGEAIFGVNDECTLFRIKNNSGVEILSDGYDCYCKASEVEKAEKYYSQFKNYNFYLYAKEENDFDKPVRIKLDEAAIQDLKQLHSQKHHTIKAGTYYGVSCESNDGVFEGDFSLYKSHDDWYLPLADVWESDYDEDECINLSSHLAECIDKAVESARVKQR